MNKILYVKKLVDFLESEGFNAAAAVKTRELVSLTDNKTFIFRSKFTMEAGPQMTYELVVQNK